MEWEAFKVVIQGFCLSKTIGIRRELEKQLGDIENRMRTLELAWIEDRNRGRL